jgi:hypothetical protein
MHKNFGLKVKIDLMETGLEDVHLILLAQGMDWW